MMKSYKQIIFNQGCSQKFLNFELTSNLFLEFLIFQDYQYIVSYERNSLTEVNATNHAETTSDRMATIPQNLESKGLYIIHCNI